MGQAGVSVIEKDLKGEVLSRSAQADMKKGSPVTLALDARLQHYAYDVLAAAVAEAHAQAASVVVLDVKTGEILVAANYPSYNPNVAVQQTTVDAGGMRNRVIADMYEPGSTMKIFSAANALKNGRYHADSIVHVGSGKLKIGRKTIEDVHADMGDVTLTEVIKKSSNVGIAKVTLDDNYTTLLDTLTQFFWANNQRRFLVKPPDLCRSSAELGV